MSNNYGPQGPQGPQTWNQNQNNVTQQNQQTVHVHVGPTIGVAPHNKSYAVYLLCLFFGGYLGLHYYYLGKIGMGVLYTCTAGLCMIGWIGDLLNPRRGFYS